MPLAGNTVVPGIAELVGDYMDIRSPFGLAAEISPAEKRQQKKSADPKHDLPKGGFMRVPVQPRHAQGNPSGQQGGQSRMFIAANCQNAADHRKKHCPTGHLGRKPEPAHCPEKQQRHPAGHADAEDPRNEIKTFREILIPAVYGQQTKQGQKNAFPPPSTLQGGKNPV